MKKLLSATGRVLFAVTFLGFGIHHLVAGSSMAAYVPAMFPGGAFWIYLTGIAQILAAISLIVQKQTRLAMLLLLQGYRIARRVADVRGAVFEGMRENRIRWSRKIPPILYYTNTPV